MTTLTVRGLDDKIIEQLKARARIRRRSLEAELRAILIQASSQPLILDALAEADRIAAMTPRKMPQVDAAMPLQAGGEP
jgi:plasmid stability protein